MARYIKNYGNRKKQYQHQIKTDDDDKHQQRFMVGPNGIFIDPWTFMESQIFVSNNLLKAKRIKIKGLLLTTIQSCFDIKLTLIHFPSQTILIASKNYFFFYHQSLSEQKVIIAAQLLLTQ